MLNNRAIHGLKVIGIIASTPRHQPVTTGRLASELGLSVSYTEILIRDLKGGDLLSAHRGPGGGYQLQQEVSNLSSWDVVTCFKNKDAEYQNPSPEIMGVFDLHQKFDEIEHEFLKAYPLSEVIKHMPKTPDPSEVIKVSNVGIHIKPIQKKLLPKAPNSVFDLPNFLNLRIA